MLTSGSHNYKWTEPSNQETLEQEMASQYIKPLSAKGIRLKRSANWEKIEDGVERQIMQSVAGSGMHVLLQCTFLQDVNENGFWQK